MTTTSKLTKDFELTVLTYKDATDETIKSIEDKIKEYAKIVKIEDDGVKRLAYPVYEQEYAHYMFYFLEIDGDNWQKLGNALNIDERVLRYLLIKCDAKYARH